MQLSMSRATEKSHMGWKRSPGVTPVGQKSAQLWINDIEEDSYTSQTNDDEVSANNLKKYSEFDPNSPEYFVSEEVNCATSEVMANIDGQ